MEMTERELTERLADLVHDEFDEELTTSTYEEAGVLTSDTGFVIAFRGESARFYVTVQKQ
jgi:hypothetical protein